MKEDGSRSRLSTTLWSKTLSKTLFSADAALYSVDPVTDRLLGDLHCAGRSRWHGRKHENVEGWKVWARVMF